jgi:hypothetical protein
MGVNMETKEYADSVKKTYSDVKDKAQDTLDKSMDVAAESGKDWLEYVKEHPAQSVLFGLIGFYALKGLLK